MDLSPIPVKTVSDRYNLLKLLRPVFFHNRLQHTAQKAVMFAERLQKTIRARKLPGRKHMLPCLIGLSQTHIVHHTDQMEIESRQSDKFH